MVFQSKTLLEQVSATKRWFPSMKTPLREVEGYPSVHHAQYERLLPRGHAVDGVYQDALSAEGRGGEVLSVA